MSQENERNSWFTRDEGFTDETVGILDPHYSFQKPTGRESVMSERWMKGGNKLIGLNRLFAKKDEIGNDHDERVAEPQEVPRYFSFPLKGEGIDSDEPGGLRNIFTDFKQVVRSDSREDKEIFRNYIFKITTRSFFRNLVNCAIVINMLLMIYEIVLETKDIKNLGDTKIYLQLINNFINGLFLVEFVLKYYAVTETFWFDSWNIFDFFLIAVSLLDSNTHVFSGNTGSTVSVFRTFRVVRVLRSVIRLRNIPAMSSMKMLLDTISRTIVEVFYILLLWFCFSILITTFGCTMFEDTVYMKIDFANFLEGLWTCFVILTQDGWRIKFENGFTEYFDKHHVPDKKHREMNFIYWYIIMIIKVVMSGLIMNSMAVASVVSSLDKAMVEDNEKGDEDDDEDDIIGVSGSLADEFDDAEKAEIRQNMRSKEGALTFMTNHSAFIKLRQKPLFKCSNGKKTTERVEDKLMLLQALERNLKEYNQIRSALDEFMEEIKTLNDLTTTNEDALRILACSKTPQSGGLNPNTMTNLRASNMSHIGIKHSRMGNSRLGGPSRTIDMDG